MPMTDYLEETLGGHMFRSSTYTKPTSHFMALFTTTPTLGDGSNGVEVAEASYARTEYNVNDLAWSAPVDGNGEFYNLFSITFPTPLEDWGTITGFGMFDASTGGNLLFFENLASTKDVLNGNPAPEFNPGSVKFTFGSL